MVSLADMRSSFETVPRNEIRLVVLGEIVSAEGFDSEPLCVHYLIETPRGWKNDSDQSSLQGITHNCYMTEDGFAHFSHDLFLQLGYSMDVVDEEDTYLRPMILFMVVSISSSGKVKHEGYGYITIPSTPGSHTIRMQTWKLKPRSIEEQMQNLFLDVSPSLQDVHSIHVPISDTDCRRPNRFGMETMPSGFVKIRLNVIHQSPASFKYEESKFDLLEKMSSATILKSVQAVIEAFHRAKKKANRVKQTTDYDVK